MLIRCRLGRWPGKTNRTEATAMKIRSANDSWVYSERCVRSAGPARRAVRMLAHHNHGRCARHRGAELICLTGECTQTCIRSIRATSALAAGHASRRRYSVNMDRTWRPPRCDDRSPSACATTRNFALINKLSLCMNAISLRPASAIWLCAALLNVADHGSRWAMAASVLFTLELQCPVFATGWHRIATAHAGICTIGNR